MKREENWIEVKIIKKEGKDSIGIRVLLIEGWEERNWREM